MYTGGLLFSQIMDWPLWVSLVVLMAIATSFTVIGAKGIKSVTVLGQEGLLTWSVEDRGLVVQLPREEVRKFA